MGAKSHHRPFCRRHCGDAGWSVTGLSREDYIDAEERVVQELKDMGKPFVILLNIAWPYAQLKADDMKNILERALN